MRQARAIGLATSLPMREGGGTATVNVTATAGCAWTAVSNDAFITVTSGASGTGNGAVGISVAANTGPFRSGTLTIAGQKPNVRLARKSIANFKLRDGMPVGLSVTLRDERAYEFLDRLMSVAIPRIRDFRGLPPRAFDGRGNYNLGVREQIIFPEIDYDRIDQVRGLDVTITTSAVTASTPVTITASAGSVTRTATLTVAPPGQNATLTVTATGRGAMPSSFQQRICSHTLRSTHSPTGTMRPVSSRMGMNSAGATSLPSCSQRRSASKPLMAPESS